MSPSLEMSHHRGRGAGHRGWCAFRALGWGLPCSLSPSREERESGHCQKESQANLEGQI
uniref:Alternative protein CRY2 n=1 Tax=Homo sapiens TaxID=9606 RepID=L8E920_HUMAN|nr:alternative protein CRY2 [Homo sapiens]